MLTAFPEESIRALVHGNARHQVTIIRTNADRKLLVSSVADPLFGSGKKHGFKALVYMHRWQKTTVATVRTDYVHELQERYRTQLSLLEDQMQTASASDHVKLKKRQEKLTAQLTEINAYEEMIHHLADMMIDIDLDDGVKVNYAKFEDILEKIK